MSELRWILLGCGVVLLAGIFLWGRRGRGQVAHSEGRSARPRTEAPVDLPEDGIGDDVDDEPVKTPPVSNRWQAEEWTDTVADLPEIRLDASSPADEAAFAAHADEPWVSVDPGIETEPNLDMAVDAPRHAQSEPSPAPVARATKPQAKVEKRKIIALRLSAVAPERYSGAKLRSALESLGLRHGRYGIFHLQDSEGASVISVASMVEPGAFDLATMADSPFAGITMFAMLPGPLPGGETCDQLFDCARRLEGLLGGALFDERGVPLDGDRIDAIRDDVLDFEHLLGSSPRPS